MAWPSSWENRAEQLLSTLVIVLYAFRTHMNIDRDRVPLKKKKKKRKIPTSSDWLLVKLELPLV